MNQTVSERNEAKWHTKNLHNWAEYSLSEGKIKYP